MNSTLNPLSIDAELAKRLERDEKFRSRYIRLWAQNEVAAAIRNLRKARGKRQGDVARMIGTGQSAVSRIEKAEYDGWTFKTLLSIAEALKARLRITFDPIEDVVGSWRHQSIGTDPADVTNVGGTDAAQAVEVATTADCAGITAALASTTDATTQRTIVH